MVAMDTETVKQGAIDTVNARETVDGNLKSLKTLCDDLAASWTGAGAQAFANVMQTWDQKSNSLLDALSDIADQLDSGAAAQAEQDAASESDFSNFDNEL